MWIEKLSRTYGCGSSLTRIVVGENTTMKKTLKLTFLTATAALTLTSCTVVEPVPVATTTTTTRESTAVVRPAATTTTTTHQTTSGGY